MVPHNSHPLGGAEMKRLVLITSPVNHNVMPVWYIYE